ncbi:MAG: choice-of-anchor S family protein [Candidatus Thorarchaeota archaeon]
MIMISMKKVPLKTSLIFSILLLFSFIGTVNGTYNLSADQEFIYHINKMNYTSRANNTWVTKDGYYVNGHLFDEGTNLTIKVKNVQSSSVDWQITADNETELGTSVENDLETFEYFMNTVSLINLGSINLNLFSFIPFLPATDTTWQTLKDVVNSFKKSNSTFGVGYIATDSSYYTKNDLLIVETLQEVRNPISETFYMNSNTNFKASYAQSTGVLHGIKVIGSFEVREGASIRSFEIETLIQLDGYYLPKMILESAPGFSWFSVLSAFVPILILLKRKERKEHSK